MAESFPSTAEQKSGGRKVILFLSSSRRRLAADEILPEKDRFSRQKNSPYTAATPLVLRRRNRVSFGSSVTTSHLFWPNQRRKVDCRLPNSLRNPILARFSLFVTCQAGGRGSVSGYRRRPRPKTAHGIFCLMDPLPCSATKKKSWAVHVAAPAIAAHPQHRFTGARQYD